MEGSIQPTKSKVAAGVLAILLGLLGIHKFYLGYAGAGIITIILTCIVVTLPIIWIVTLIEGIIYLTKSDDAFHQTYVMNKKAWF